MTDEPILQVKGLSKSFGNVRAVKDISFSLRQGEIFSLVGESGSGKTTAARCIIRIYRPDEGSILFQGKDISGSLSRAGQLELAKNMQMIFQDPLSSLNPKKTVFDIIASGLDVHRLYGSKKERTEKVHAMMEEVGLSPELSGRRPIQFSGGQRQRIAIARALIIRPSLIIADEPLSSLDVSIQSQIVNLLLSLREKYGITLLFIGHDLRMVRFLSDRIAVMQEGEIVECKKAEDLFSRPSHPYTQSLLGSILSPVPNG